MSKSLCSMKLTGIWSIAAAVLTAVLLGIFSCGFFTETVPLLIGLT